MRKRGSNLMVAGIVTLCTIGMGAFPIYYTYSMRDKNLTTSNNALSGQAVIRGVFLNSGTRDAGPDPDWDVETRTWRGRSSQKQRRDQTKEGKEDDKV